MENDKASFIDYCAIAVVISGIMLIVCVLKWGCIHVNAWQRFVPFIIPATGFFEVKVLTRTANVFMFVHCAALLLGAISYKCYAPEPASWNKASYSLSLFWGWLTFITIGIVIFLLIFILSIFLAAGNNSNRNNNTW